MREAALSSRELLCQKVSDIKKAARRQVVTIMSQQASQAQHVIASHCSGSITGTKPEISGSAFVGDQNGFLCTHVSICLS